MNKFTLAKRLLLLVSIVLFASCDKDFNTIGSDIVGNDYFKLEKDSLEVVVNNFPTGPVQSNNLILNSLGTYTDPKFGRTTSHFVTQATLQVSNVTVNTHPVVDSVWVYVPFYLGDEKATDANGVRSYELDSIYGDENDTDLATQQFKLKVYENGYFLGDYNPNNTNGIERHFSDEKAKIESNIRGAATDNTSIPNGHYLNNSLEVAENEAFFFNNKERIIYKTDGHGKYLDEEGVVLPPEDQDDVSKWVVKERFAPGIWLKLNNEYFAKRILLSDTDPSNWDNTPDHLTNSNTFKQYFRGLYFQVEALSGDQGALASLDFSKGYIRINYNTDNVANSPTPTDTRLKSFLQIRLGGNSVNFFDNTNPLPNPSNRIVLKGGAGSVATIDLFDLSEDANHNQVPDKLEQLREEAVAKNWMINEASLTFYVDKEAMANSKYVEPNRIYVYDAKNKKPIVDYNADGTTNSSNPKLNKRGFGGIIQKDGSGHGVKYKFGISEHVRNLIFKDSTNYTLGLSVTESINLSNNSYLKPPAGQQADAIIPLGSVLSPLGTILYDANADNREKRIKLEIYFTKPD